MDFFKEFEKELNLSIPVHIKNQLRFHSFDKHQTLSEINETHIKEIEDFARNVLKHIIAKDEFRNYYGVFEKNIDKFMFLSGEKIIINKLQSLSKKKVSEANMNDAEEPAKKPLEDISSSCIKIDLTNENKKLRKHVTRGLHVLLNEMNDYEKLTLLERFNDIDIYCELQTSTNPSNEEENLLMCNIKCIYCETVTKVRQYKRNNNNHWIVTNYYRHLRSHLAKKNGMSSSSNTSQKVNINYFEKLVSEPAETDEIGDQDDQSNYIKLEPCTEDFNPDFSNGGGNSSNGMDFLE